MYASAAANASSRSLVGTKPRSIDAVRAPAGDRIADEPIVTSENGSGPRPTAAAKPVEQRVPVLAASHADRRRARTARRCRGGRNPSGSYAVGTATPEPTTRCSARSRKMRCRERLLGLGEEPQPAHAARTAAGRSRAWPRARRGGTASGSLRLGCELAARVGGPEEVGREHEGAVAVALVEQVVEQPGMRARRRSSSAAAGRGSAGWPATICGVQRGRARGAGVETTAGKRRTVTFRRVLDPGGQTFSHVKWSRAHVVRTSTSQPPVGQARGPAHASRTRHRRRHPCRSGAARSRSCRCGRPRQPRLGPRSTSQALPCRVAVAPGGSCASAAPGGARVHCGKPA